MSHDTQDKEPLYFDNTLSILVPILIVGLLVAIFSLVFIG